MLSDCLSEVSSTEIQKMNSSMEDKNKTFPRKNT